MVYNNDSQDEEKSLAYDLRQIYAKIVGEHVLDVAEARKAENFYVWFKAIEDLHTITRFKFDDPEEDEKVYIDKKNNIIGLANKYASCWNGQTKVPREFAEIEKSLRDLEEYLYIKMNEGGMFGRGYVYDEDEI